ncbi:MAG: hypothetical protein QNJ89_01385 [Acidimicrobiia bacterium]|nr:hypothetical protein [Acidimicrobiia bacterium]
MINARRTIFLAMSVALFVAGCGGDDASETTMTTLVTTQAAVAPTDPPTGSTEPPTTTAPLPTTVPVTTTVAPTTTTLPPGAHPVAGILWADLLPGPEDAAVYRVDMVVPDTPMSHQWGVAGDLQARMEYGVEWFGRAGTYDRLVFGLDGPGTPGLVFYFRLDDPWVVEFLGMEAWPAGDTGRGPEAVETFAEPATLDLSGGTGETFTLDGFVTAIDSFGVDELDASVAVTLRNAEAGPVTVAAGTFERAMVYEILLFGPIVGGPDFPIEITVSPGNLILRMSMPGASIELLESWG